MTRCAIVAERIAHNMPEHRERLIATRLTKQARTRTRVRIRWPTSRSEEE
jgi:hypothetical protein